MYYVLHNTESKERIVGVARNNVSRKYSCGKIHTTKDATAAADAMLLPQKQQNMHMHCVTLHSGM